MNQNPEQKGTRIQMRKDRIKLEIAYRFRKARRIAGLTQAELGESLGLNRVTISYIEGGMRSVKAQELGAITQKLGVTVEWLLG